MNEGAPFIIESKFVNNVNITTFNVHVPILFYLLFFSDYYLSIQDVQEAHRKLEKQ